MSKENHKRTASAESSAWGRMAWAWFGMFMLVTVVGLMYLRLSESSRAAGAAAAPDASSSAAASPTGDAAPRLHDEVQYFQDRAAAPPEAPSKPAK